MADQILEKVRDLAEGQIDFDGQKFSELLATILLATSGAIAFVVGFVLQDIKLALYIGLAGTALTFVAIVPPWPFFKRNPVKWLPTAQSQHTNLVVPQEIVVVDAKATT